MFKHWILVCLSFTPYLLAAPATLDPFDPASCSGAPLTKQQAIDMLIEGIVKPLGAVRLHVREKVSHKHSTVVPSWKNSWTYLAYEDAALQEPKKNEPGVIMLIMESNVLRLFGQIGTGDPTAKLAAFSYVPRSYTIHIELPIPSGDRLSWTDYSPEVMVRPGYSDTILDSHIHFGKDGPKAKFSGKLTKDCFRMQAKGSIDTQDSLNNDVHVDIEAVLFSDTSKSDTLLDDFDKMKELFP